MYKADLPVLVDDIEPLFHINKDKHSVVVYGRSPSDGFYYYFTSTNKDHHFYKSATSNPADAVEMTKLEEQKLLSDLIKLSSGDKDALSTLMVMQHFSTAYWQQKDAQELLRQHKERQKAGIDQQKNHSHQNERERKYQQRENILKKYKDIAPVFLDEQQTQIGAKMNDEYIFISLNNKKPYFLKLSLKGSKPMTMHDLADFINFAGNSSRVGEVLLYSTPYFQKFLSLKSQTPHPSYAISMHDKVQETLYRRLSTFDAIERNEISQKKLSQGR